MYLMYVDESGDSGLTNSPTKHFALSGIVVHESRWRDFMAALINFRKTIRLAHGLPIRTEIHASEYIKKKIHGLDRHIRLAILRNFIDEIATIDFISITNVIIMKNGKPLTYDVFDMAWKCLFQRFEDTMKYGNFPGGHRQDGGLLITDATSGLKLTRLVRRMAVHNYIPHDQSYGSGSRNMPLMKIIEDPHEKDSRMSLPIQAADVCAYFLAQRFFPNSYVRKHSAASYFNRLDPVLNKNASRYNPQGIVIL